MKIDFRVVSVAELVEATYIIYVQFTSPLGREYPILDKLLRWHPPEDKLTQKAQEPAVTNSSAGI